MFFISSKVSDGNMDFRFGNIAEVLKNRKKFFKKVGINPKQVAEVTQIHGRKIIRLDQILDPETRADGLMTTNAAIYLMLKVADCIAIGFFDPKNQAIALVHAGWRGLTKGIIKNAVTKMRGNFQTKPEDLKVKFSPSIGPCCYRTDLWKEAERKLKKNGILKQNIDNPKICTYHNDNYFSHRRSADQKKDDSRFVTILGI